MIGHESPSRLQQAFELLPSAFLLKPVRPSGVYTAIFFAINGHARDRLQARPWPAWRRAIGRGAWS